MYRILQLIGNNKIIVSGLQWYFSKDLINNKDKDNL